jgi:hypothetical protein
MSDFEKLLRAVMDDERGVEEQLRAYEKLKEVSSKQHLPRLYQVIRQSDDFGLRELMGRVADLGDLGADVHSLREGLGAMADFVAALGEHMRELGVSAALVERPERRQARRGSGTSRTPQQSRDRLRPGQTRRGRRRRAGPLVRGYLRVS